MRRLRGADGVHVAREEGAAERADARVSAQAHKAQLFEALRQLSPRHRDVLLLYGWAELDLRRDRGGRFPGTSCSRSPATRAEGRPAIGLRYPGLQTTLLDPETLAYLGMQDGMTEINEEIGMASFVSSVEAVAAVSELGQRPQG